ncbi:MAG TPA: hypothetical protein VK436_13000 [Methanocella sp.]|nr:hypothetical protein [Methanocella sp.]
MVYCKKSDIQKMGARPILVYHQKGEPKPLNIELNIELKANELLKLLNPKGNPKPPNPKPPNGKPKHAAAGATRVASPAMHATSFLIIYPILL